MASIIERHQTLKALKYWRSWILESFKHSKVSIVEGLQFRKASILKCLNDGMLSACDDFDFWKRFNFWKASMSKRLLFWSASIISYKETRGHLSQQKLPKMALAQGRNNSGPHYLSANPLHATGQRIFVRKCAAMGVRTYLPMVCEQRWMTPFARGRICRPIAWPGWSGGVGSASAPLSCRHLCRKDRFIKSWLDFTQWDFFQKFNLFNFFASRRWQHCNSSF